MSLRRNGFKNTVAVAFSWVKNNIKEKIDHSKTISNPCSIDSVLLPFDYQEAHQIDFKCTKAIDIIVPVYNGFDIILPLLESIPKTKLSYRLILVDDNSSDVRILPFLRKYASEHTNVIVIENEENLGYTSSVNKGLRLAKGDVVLLNTDVRLPQNWLERLIAPLMQEPSIASATPFTNSGTICSFPHFFENNELYLNYTVDEIDSVFSRLKPSYTEIPTGVGFCMAISKSAINKVGLLDEKRFPRGYGEENDWCQRAIRKGFRNVMVEM